VSTSDAWLGAWVPKILASADYRQGRTALFITWDEGSGGASGTNCRTLRPRSCHVATVVVTPTTKPGTRSGVRFDHYSLLKTTERMFGFSTLLGHAGDASTTGLRGPFGL